MKYTCKCGAVTAWLAYKQDLKCPHCKTNLEEVTTKQEPTKEHELKEPGGRRK